MRQTLTTTPGQSLRSVLLPDGGLPAAISIDNNTGYWYQIAPAGEWVAPYTTGVVISTDGASPDVLAMPTGPAGQVSATTGDTVVVTVYDAQDAPADSRGNPTAWLTPGQTGIRSLGSVNALAPSQGGPAIASYRVLPTERAILILMPVSGTYAPYTGYVRPHGAAASAIAYSFTGYPGTWIVAPIAPDLYPNPSQLWDVAIEATYATPALGAVAYAFAVSSLPVVDLAVGRGQQLSVASLPVVVAADQASFPVQIDSRQIPLSVQAMGQDGTQGQHTMATSSPVVIASDQIVVVSQSPGQQASYQMDSSLQIQVPSATGRLWFYVYGGGKTIYLKRLRIGQYAAATTGGAILLGLVHLGSLPSGGTAGAPRALVDGGPASASTGGFVSASTFTSDGAIGVRVMPIVVPVTTSAGNDPYPSLVEIDFGKNPGGQQPTTAKGLGIYYVGSTGGVAGTPTFIISMEWGEA